MVRIPFTPPVPGGNIKWVTGIKKAPIQLKGSSNHCLSANAPKQSEASAQIHGRATSHEWQTSVARELSPQMRGLTRSPVARVTNTPTGDPKAQRVTGYKQRLAN